MIQKIKDKVVIITGGAGLFGTQHIKAVINNGGKAVVIDINLKKINIIKKKFKHQDKDIMFVRCDITKEMSVKAVLKKILQKYDRIDVLINNASIDYPPLKDNKRFKLENFTINDFKKDINVSLIGSLICTKIFGGYMAKKKGGVILNIASDLALIAPDNRIYNNGKKLDFVKPISYSISKHGLIGLTKYTATYWANKNIRCNALASGGIFNNQKSNFLKKIKKLIPLGRMAKQGEYENAILFLISNDSSYMTGSTLVLDGGRTAW
tara:strand:- start:11928 stop:12725 length:798 start_codon:yes stop_codon:yes gene_type:complete